MEKTLNPWALPPFLKKLKEEKFIRECISNYFHVFLSMVENKDGFILMKLMYDPLQYLSSPVLKISETPWSYTSLWMPAALQYQAMALHSG